MKILQRALLTVASSMISTLSCADALNEATVLKQMDFFLFLADSIDVGGELTTLVDMETVEIESLDIEVSPPEEISKSDVKQSTQEEETLK